MDSTADRPNIENLKEYPGRPAMDEGLQNTTLNPDAELTKLNADVELQSTALGHSPASHGYEDIHAREQPGENTPTAATVDSLEYSLGSVSRLPAPDVGLNVPTTEEDSFRDGSNIIAIPRENIPHTVSSQQSQVDTSAQRGDNLSLVTRQQGEGQDQGHQVEGEDESESEGYSVGNRSQGQDQTEVHESQGEGQNDDVSIETNLNNQTTEVIDNLADLEKESLLSED